MGVNGFSSKNIRRAILYLLKPYAMLSEMFLKPIQPKVWV